MIIVPGSAVLAYDKANNHQSVILFKLGNGKYLISIKRGREKTGERALNCFFFYLSRRSDAF